MRVSLTHCRLQLRIVAVSAMITEDEVRGLRREDLLLHRILTEFEADLATVMCCPYKVVLELCVCMCA